MINLSINFVIGGVLIPANLCYDPANPFETILTFKLPQGHVTWIFGRDILIDSLNERAGVGDVQAWIEDGVYQLHLEGPDGEAHLQTDPAYIRLFVKHMLDEVPVGTETLDIEGELESLFNGG